MSVRERIYPTEFDPAELPQVVTGPIDPKTVIITPSNPTAFLQRDVGHILEAEASFTAGDDSVNLTIAPELVEFVGDKTWGRNESATTQPQFHTMKNNLTINVKFGGSELIGTFTPPAAEAKGAADMRILGFVSAMKMAATSQREFENARTNPPPPGIRKEKGTRAPDPFGGDGDGPTPPGMVSVITEYIEVDATLASSFARELNGTADATEIRRRLDGVIASGGARLVETSTALTHQEVRTKAESILEFTYGIEPSASQQPHFETIKLTTSAQIADGTSLLLAMHSLETARAGQSATKDEQEAVKNRRLLVFITVRVKSGGSGIEDRVPPGGKRSELP